MTANQIQEAMRHAGEASDAAARLAGYLMGLSYSPMDPEAIRKVEAAHRDLLSKVANVSGDLALL